MKSKAALNMPDEPNYRLKVTPFWLDVFFVSVASWLFLGVSTHASRLSARTLLNEPMEWLTPLLIIYACHLFAAYILLPTFLRHDYPKAALLWSSVIAWLLLSGMTGGNVCYGE